MSAELNNEQEQSGQQSVDDYAAAFDEATSEVKPEDKETSQDDDSGSWIPEEEGKKEDEAAKKDDGSKDEYTPETIDTENPPEALKDHPYYKSMKGRVDLERRRADELEARLRAVESEKPRQQSYPMQFEKAEIPEDIKEDVEAFKKAYPELAIAAELKGLEGDIVRRQIAEYGVDYAAGTALVVVKDFNRNIESGQKELAKYQAGVFEKRPDIKEMSEDEYEAYTLELMAWIKRKPKEEQDKLISAYNAEKGFDTPKHLVDLFNEFDKSRTLKNTPHETNTNKRRQAIDDGLAVPSSARGAFRKPPEKPKEDYAGAFEEACAS